jgi:rSAM/selenodomain-associated transferase 1
VSTRPALIIFCREPVPGNVKTRLARRIGGRAAALLADAFIRDSMAKALRLAPSRLVIAGRARGGVLKSAYFRGLARTFSAEIADQGSGGLGAAMARALQAHASAGGALLIGTDTPTLPLRCMRTLMASLRKAPVVVAPSLDGGYYAIGVRGAIPPVFSAMTWGRAQVFRDTLARLRGARIPYTVGPAWYDVDRFDDLLMLAAHLRLLGARRSGPAAHPCPSTARVMRRLGLLENGR